MARFIQASFHQGNAKYYGRARQCMANALSSLIMAQMRSPQKWNADTLNVILENGDSIYKCSSVNSYMMLEDLPKESVFYDNLKLNNILSGSIHQKITEGPYFTLENALDQTLKDITSSCLITIGKSNPSYSCCIIRENGTYYFFDPHSRSTKGMPISDGFATLTEYDSRSALCDFLCQLSSMLFTSHMDVQFEIATVSLSPSQTTDNASSDTQSFDGFSEVSEGEVTCKRYMLNEGLEQSSPVSDVSSCSIICDTDSSENIPLSLLQTRIANNDRVISEPDDSFSDIGSSGSEYKFTAFEKKLLNNELSESEVTLSDDDLYYTPPLKKKKFNKKVHNLRTHTVKKVKTSTPKFKLDPVGTNSRHGELHLGVTEKMVGADSFVGVDSVMKGDSRVGAEDVGGGDGVKEGDTCSRVDEEDIGDEDGVMEGDRVGEEAIGGGHGGIGDSRVDVEGVVGSDGVKEGDSRVYEEDIGDGLGVMEGDSRVAEENIGFAGVVDEDGIVGVEVIHVVGLEGTADVEGIVGLDDVGEDNLGVDDMIGAEIELGVNGIYVDSMVDQNGLVNVGGVGDENGMQDVDGVVGGESIIDGESVTEVDSLLAGESMADANTSGRDKASCRSRKRTRNPDTWKRNIQKRLKNTGKEFINVKGVPQHAKYVKPGCGNKCRYKCHTFLSREVREDIFHKFWGLGNVTQQRQFILKHSEPKGKANKTVPGRSRRSNSFKYTLPYNENSIRVCQTFFLHTLNITGQMVQTALKKSLDFPGVCEPDKRGRHSTRPNRTPDDQIKYVKDHIASFPTVESHYCRKNSKKMYLSPGLSVPKMYSLYCETCAKDSVQPVKLSVYRSVFDHCFNISFFKPVKDQCDTCNRYRNSSATVSENEKLMQENHLKNKVAARENKEHDKMIAKSEHDNTFIASCFDLEQVLVTPKGFESTLYYKRRLNTYNFSVYNLGTGEAHCYLWNETLAGRGACEISSCIYRYIQLMAEKGKRKFVFFSDNCGAQNKNKYYVSMLWYAMQKFNLISVEHKYLEKGHTQNENDSVHAAIEAASRHVSVYSSSQWAAIIRTARPKDPYLVKEMDGSDFFNFKNVANALKNFDLDTERQKVYWSEVRTFCIQSEDPNTIVLRYNYDGPVHSLNLVQRLRRTQVIVNPENIVLERLHTEQIPITWEKYSDLISLCKNEIIPKVHHIFYLLLPHHLQD